MGVQEFLDRVERAEEMGQTPLSENRMLAAATGSPVGSRTMRLARPNTRAANASYSTSKACSWPSAVSRSNSSGLRCWSAG